MKLELTAAEATLVMHLLEEEAYTVDGLIELEEGEDKKSLINQVTAMRNIATRIKESL